MEGLALWNRGNHWLGQTVPIPVGKAYKMRAETALYYSVESFLFGKKEAEYE